MPSLGSGFVISPDGYIVTNNHVVEDVDKIKVAFSDGRRRLEATVVGRDPKTDIALIHVKTDRAAVRAPARRLREACARATGWSRSAIPSGSSTR